MLEIRDVQYFADGRSVIDTVGGRRFKVLSRDTKDGYDTATVEFFQDECPSENEVEGKILIFFFGILLKMKEKYAVTVRTNWFFKFYLLQN